MAGFRQRINRYSGNTTATQTYLAHRTHKGRMGRSNGQAELRWSGEMRWTEGGGGGGHTVGSSPNTWYRSRVSGSSSAMVWSRWDRVSQGEWSEEAGYRNYAGCCTVRHEEIQKLIQNGTGWGWVCEGVGCAVSSGAERVPDWEHCCHSTSSVDQPEHSCPL